MDHVESGSGSKKTADLILPRKRAHIVPYNLLVLGYLEEVSAVCGSNESVPVGKPLRTSLPCCIEAVGRRGRVLPLNVSGPGVHFNNRRPVPFRPFRPVVKNQEAVAPEIRGVMVAEHLLVAVVQEGRRFSLSVGALVAPSINHFTGLVVYDVEFAEVPGI